MEGVKKKRKSCISDHKILVNSILLDRFDRAKDIINDLSFEINKPYFKGDTELTYMTIASRYKRVNFIVAMIERGGLDYDDDILHDLLDLDNAIINKDIIQRLLKKEYHTNWPWDWPHSVLYYTIKYGNIEILSFLVSQSDFDANEAVLNLNIFQLIYKHYRISHIIKEEMALIVINAGVDVLPIRDKIIEKKWRLYQKRWSVFTHIGYPTPFRYAVVRYLLTLEKQEKTIPRDLRHMIVGYVAENYKKNI